MPRPKPPIAPISTAVFNGLFADRASLTPAHGWTESLTVKAIFDGPLLGVYLEITPGFMVQIEVGDVVVYDPQFGLSIEAGASLSHYEADWSPREATP